MLFDDHFINQLKNKAPGKKNSKLKNTLPTVQLWNLVYWQISTIKHCFYWLNICYTSLAHK